MSQAEALLLSLVLEVPLLVAVAWAAGDRRVGRWIIVGALATCLTHPIVWHGTLGLRPWIPDFAIRAALFETFAIGVEGLVFRWQMDWPLGRALALSLLANGFSFGLGLLWF